MWFHFLRSAPYPKFYAGNIFFRSFFGKEPICITMKRKLVEVEEIESSCSSSNVVSDGLLPSETLEVEEDYSNSNALENSSLNSFVPLDENVDDKHMNIFLRILSLCPEDLKAYVEPMLMFFIRRYCNDGITSQIESIRSIHKNFAPLRQLHQDKDLMGRIIVILKSCIVYFVSQQYCYDKDVAMSDFLDAYPSFREPNIESDELQKLFSFWNNMKIAISFIPPNQNKRLLLDICALLEGDGNNYITGGAQVPATNRRVEIYLKESHVKPQIRSSRSRSDSAKSQVTCDCGAIVSTLNLTRHKETARHKAAMLKL